MPTLPINWNNLLRPAAGGFSAEYQAVYDSMTNQPSASVAAAQNAMVAALVAGGVWVKLDIFFLFAQESNAAAEALINWLSPGTDATAVSAPLFTSLEGFTGDGGADYINSNFNPNSDGVNYTLNDCCAFGYYRIDQQGNVYDFGVTDGVPAHLIIRIRNTSDVVNAFINSAGSMAPANTNSAGLFAIERTASNATEVFRNASSLGTDNDASSSLPNEDVYILARNNNGTNADESGNQVSVWGAGASLSTGEHTTLRNAIETYMDSNGKGVIP